jgi:peptidoglycan/xylan/chitin deacetylase (PgdA/CDA1 family)
VLYSKEEKNICNQKNIWMFHRVRFDNHHIGNIYDLRGMVHEFNDIIRLIDLAIKKGKKFGSIAQTFMDKNAIHLSFDDGYKEHLIVAKALKKRYNFPVEAITFSINIRNSFYSKKFCMDIIYQWIENRNSTPFQELFGMELSTIDINHIKKIIFSDKHYIHRLNSYRVNLDNYFLNESEVIELSKLFSIGSHVINHSFLNSLNRDEVYNELKESKEFLESKLRIPIDTLCYPEGKSDIYIEEIAQRVGYKFGLSISSGTNIYKIGRVIPQ